MSAVDTDAWTCPRCEDTVRGSKRHRNHHQKIHARRHGTIRAVMHAAPTPPAGLVIPTAPRERRHR